MNLDDFLYCPWMIYLFILIYLQFPFLIHLRIQVFPVSVSRNFKIPVRRAKYGTNRVYITICIRQSLHNIFTYLQFYRFYLLLDKIIFPAHLRVSLNKLCAHIYKPSIIFIKFLYTYILYTICRKSVFHILNLKWNHMTIPYRKI